MCPTMCVCSCTCSCICKILIFQSEDVFGKWVKVRGLVAIVQFRERNWGMCDTCESPHKDRGARVCGRASGIRSHIKHGTCSLACQATSLYWMRQVYAWVAKLADCIWIWKEVSACVRVCQVLYMFWDEADFLMDMDVRPRQRIIIFCECVFLWARRSDPSAAFQP